MENIKINFSPYPFRGAAADQFCKTNFSSDDEIYGLLELPRTVADYFGIQPGNDVGYFVDYTIRIFKDGKQMGGSNQWHSMHLSDDDIIKKQLKIDVLPGGFNSTTRIFKTRNITSGFTSAPLGWMTHNVHFPEDGLYNVQIRIANNSVSIESTFNLQFRKKDIPSIAKKVMSAEESTKEKIGSYVKPSADGLPFEWRMEAAPSQSGHSEQEIKALIKEKLGDEGTIIKFIIEPTVHINWLSENNDDGTLKRKYHHQMIFIFKEENGRYKFFEGYLQQQYRGGTHEKVEFTLTRSGEYTSAKPFKLALSKKVNIL